MKRTLSDEVEFLFEAIIGVVIILLCESECLLKLCFRFEGVSMLTSRFEVVVTGLETDAALLALPFEQGRVSNKFKSSFGNVCCIEARCVNLVKF
jgi:hypothetical protein